MHCPCFKAGLACSQAVFASFAEDLGLPGEKALMIASGFGAGMGRMSLTCGAVTGAFMVLGLRNGYSIADDKESKEEMYRLIREFGDKFRAMHGSLECRRTSRIAISRRPTGIKQPPIRAHSGHYAPGLFRVPSSIR